MCQLIGNFTLFENTPLKIKELTQKYFPINQFYDDVYALRTVRQVTIVLKTLQSIYCFCVMSPAKCRLWSIAAHRDHFVRHLSVNPSVSPVVTLFWQLRMVVICFWYSGIAMFRRRFLGMLPLFLIRIFQSISQNLQRTSLRIAVVF